MKLTPEILTERFADLGKLNIPMVVRFWAQANFQYCSSCLQKSILDSKVIKIDPKNNHLASLI